MTDQETFNLHIGTLLMKMDRRDLATVFGDGSRDRVLLGNDVEEFIAVIYQGRHVLHLVPVLSSLYTLHSTTDTSDEQRLHYFIFWSFVRNFGPINSLPFFSKLFSTLTTPKIENKFPDQIKERSSDQIGPEGPSESKKSPTQFDIFFERFSKLGGTVVHGCRETGFDATSIYNSSPEELKWALEQDKTFLSASDKLRIVQFHRRYGCHTE